MRMSMRIATSEPDRFMVLSIVCLVLERRAGACLQPRATPPVPASTRDIARAVDGRGSIQDKATGTSIASLAVLPLPRRADPRDMSAVDNCARRVTRPVARRMLVGGWFRIMI
jgi:hypothetical protein